MAETHRSARPLSPHLSVYRRQLNMMMSILHRITGLSLTLAAVLIVWWLLAAATDPEHFARVDGLMTSWLGDLVMVLSLAALCYHFFTGVRHLIWDTGAGFTIDQIRVGGYVVLAAAAAMFVITILATI